MISQIFIYRGFEKLISSKAKDLIQVQPQRQWNFKYTKRSNLAHFPTLHLQPNRDFRIKEQLIAGTNDSDQLQLRSTRKIKGSQNSESTYRASSSWPETGYEESTKTQCVIEPSQTLLVTDAPRDFCFYLDFFFFFFLSEHGERLDLLFFRFKLGMRVYVEKLPYQILSAKCLEIATKFLQFHLINI